MQYINLNISGHNISGRLGDKILEFNKMKQKINAFKKLVLCLDEIRKVLGRLYKYWKHTEQQI